MKYVASSVVISKKEAHFIVELRNRPLTSRSGAAATGSCQVGGSSDNPDPYCVQNDCSGNCALKSQDLGNGQTEYWCECS